MLKEEFLRLLREDAAFREEVRRQVLTDDVLVLPVRVDHVRAEMHEASRRVWEAIERLLGQMRTCEPRPGQLECG
ncbi:MAG: hypothetical protein NZ742_10150 [Acidobacteria bacterium]|nr:hypothetical protein [Acidobacteriota bacterium]MDW7985106.1 hypothetical protein [Acidobacteriota bacterium]